MKACPTTNPRAMHRSGSLVQTTECRDPYILTFGQALLLNSPLVAILQSTPSPAGGKTEKTATTVREVLPTR